MLHDKMDSPAGRPIEWVSRRLVEAGARGAYVEQERGRGGKPRVMAPPGGPRMGAGRIGPTPVYDGDTPGLLGHREALARTDARRDPVGRPADAARRDPTQCSAMIVRGVHEEYRARGRSPGLS